MHRKLFSLAVVLLLLYGCGREPDPPYEGRVIVLMYHRITEGEAGNLYERSVADFEADLQYLADNNIRVIDFTELAEMVTEGVTPETDCAIITFDDGDHSWYSLARPLLIEYRMPATFFLWAEKIGADSFLSWEEVTLMSHYYNEYGIRPFTFGSHTLYHQYLYDRRYSFSTMEEYNAYLDEELGGSKILIDDNVAGSISALSLPYGNGAGDPTIIAAAVRNGYSFIRTSEWNAVTPDQADLHRIPSLPILDDTDQSLIGQYLGL